MIDKEKPKTFYDKQLGFGEAPANQMLKEGQGKGVIGGKHVTDFLMIGKQADAAQLSAKDPNADL